tara:strand:- start:270 stop:830 length:561 start_codon:yes stop_codon:yes gene_type:complete
MTKRSGFKMRSGNRSSFKMMGSSPTKSTGIFDSKGNRISMDQATTLEGKGEKVTYTEGDAIKKAESEKEKTTTTEGKKKWQAEINAQSSTIEKRKADKTKTIVQTSDRGVSNTGPTKGKLYTAKHELDKKLQTQVEEGTYDPKDEPSQLVTKDVGYGMKTYKNPESLYRKGKSNFPTIGQIEKTKE